MKNHEAWFSPPYCVRFCRSIHPFIQPSALPPSLSLFFFFWCKIYINLGFLGSSTCKKSACNAGDPSSIPGLKSSPGEGIGYPLLYSWASLVAQLVKNLPAMWETWVPSLGWGNPLEEGMTTYSSILAWRITMDRGAWWTTVHGVTKSRTRLSG